MPPAEWNYHRQWYVAISTKRSHRQLKYCRSAFYTDGRQIVPAEPATHSNRGQGKARSTIQGIYALLMSLIMVMTQRGLCLDSRATNHAFPCMMAQRTKCATLISNAMQTNKQTRPNSYHQVKEQGMHARCNAT
mgnify:CR=1 FL=1